MTPCPTLCIILPCIASTGMSSVYNIDYYFLEIPGIGYYTPNKEYSWMHGVSHSERRGIELPQIPLHRTRTHILSFLIER